MLLQSENRVCLLHVAACSCPTNKAKRSTNTSLQAISFASHGFCCCVLSDCMLLVLLVPQALTHCPPKGYDIFLASFGLKRHYKQVNVDHMLLAALCLLSTHYTLTSKAFTCHHMQPCSRHEKSTLIGQKRMSIIFALRHLLQSACFPKSMLFVFSALCKSHYVAVRELFLNQR